MAIGKAIGAIGKSVATGLGKASPKLLGAGVAVGTSALIGGIVGDLNEEEGGASVGAMVGLGAIGVGALLGSGKGISKLAAGLGKGAVLGTAGAVTGKQSLKYAAGKAVKGNFGIGKSMAKGAGAAIDGINTAGAFLGAAAVGTIGAAADMAKGAINAPKKLTMTNIFDARFNKFGAAAIAGSLVIGGATSVGQSYFDNRQGVSDGQMRVATPMLPTLGQDQMNGRNSYANNAGASGDIVFAMRNNR